METSVRWNQGVTYNIEQRSDSFVSNLNFIKVAAPSQQLWKLNMLEILSLNLK